MSACVVNVAVSVGSWGSEVHRKCWFWRCFVTLQLYRTITISTCSFMFDIGALMQMQPLLFLLGELLDIWNAFFKWFLQCSWLFQRFICLGVHWRCWIASPSTVTLLLDDCCISVQTHYCPFAFVRPVFKGPAMDLLTFLSHLFSRVCFPCRYLSLSVVYPIKCVIIFALLLEMISREK